MNEDIKKEIREIIHTYCGGNYENRRMATELILQKCQEKQLTLTDVVKSLPQDNYCNVCNLPTDGEKCYSKRCPV